MLDEATQLVDAHPRAALVLSASVIEIGVRDVLFSPILHGSFHTGAAADLIVSLVVMMKNEKVGRALLNLLAKHTGVDLRMYSRPGASKPIWDEITEIQKTRNRILHIGKRASRDEARQCVIIAEALLGRVFQDVLKYFKLHLHAGTHVCGSKGCAS